MLDEVPHCSRCGLTIVDGSSRTICKSCWSSLRKTVRNNNKRARKCGAIGSISTRDWYRVLLQHDFSCANCRASWIRNGTKMTMDHVHPLSKGGMNSRINIQPLCQHCHTIKDGNPNISPWHEEIVLQRRAQKQRSRSFMNKLRMNLIQEFYIQNQEELSLASKKRQKLTWHEAAGSFYLDMKIAYQAALDHGYEEDFSSYVIETLLDYYMSKR